jgi:hypothetical protein
MARKNTKGNNRGFHLVVARGKILAEEHPEIAEEYRRGKTLKELSREYSSDFGISERIAECSIWEALNILLNVDERRRLGREHIMKSSKVAGAIGGRTTYRLGKGIYGLSEEKKRVASKLGGKRGGTIGGKKALKQKKGIFDPGFDLKSNSRNAVLSRGMIPYEDLGALTEHGFMDEKSYIVALKNTGKFSWREIQEKTNLHWSYNRSQESMRAQYNQFWRKEVLVRELKN